MPGLIDMHTHVTYPDRASPFDEQGSEGAGTLRGQRNLRYFLESGFTSVRDLNGVSNAPFLLSQWSAANMIPAPRVFAAGWIITGTGGRSEEHTSELQSLMRISYAVFCLKKKTQNDNKN